LEGGREEAELMYFIPTLLTFTIACFSSENSPIWYKTTIPDVENSLHWTFADLKEWKSVFNLQLTTVYQKHLQFQFKALA